MSYAVRIIYPGRTGKTGKRSLVVTKPTRASATAYAKKVARRGFTKYGTKANAPVACLYNLDRWGQKPLCYKAARAGFHSTMRKAVVTTSYTGLGGLSRRRRRRR